MLLAWYSTLQPTSFCPPSLGRVAVLRWSLSSHTGRCEHGVCPFQSKSARQGGCRWFLQFCRQACVPNAGLLLPREESQVCWDYRNQFVSYVYKLPIKIIFGFVFFHLNNHLRNFGRNLCAILGKLFSRQEPQFPYDITELWEAPWCATA